MADIIEEPILSFIPPLGPLAAALAKAQSEFGAVTRSKTVTVNTKTGGSYQFSYAPLDVILNVVRKPLSKNGLALVQLLDSDLVTMLIHDSGASLEARTPLPSTNDIQAYGSAITYLRRYAIQAMLGIAAEEDDDGNRAVGNRAANKPRQRDVGAYDEPPDRPELDRPVDGLIGTAEVGKTRDSDFELRETPDGWALGFRLTQGRTGFKVLTFGPLAEALQTLRPTLEGQRVTVWGTMVDEKFTNAKGVDITYKVVHAERVATPEGVIPAPDGPAEAPSETLPWEPLDAEEQALVAGGL